jgi:DNA-directed RNA polymerase subunit RPC12/RpoP
LVHVIGGDRPPEEKVKPGAPLVVFTIIRMHVLYMASFNPQYVQQADRWIDWDYFKRDTLKLGEIVRAHPLFADDAFGQARAQLSKTVKSPNSRVHRLRKRSMAVCLADRCNDMLEKTIFKSYQLHTQDTTKLRAMLRGTESADTFFTATTIGRYMAHHVGADASSLGAPQPSLLNISLEMSELACKFYLHHLHVPVKSAILNALLDTRPAERMTQQSFTMMLLAEYGSVSSAAILLLSELCSVYTLRAMPKEFDLRINRFEMHDFVVICFYLNMVALLEKMSFVTLDAETVRRTHVAMVRKRHKLYAQEGVDACLFMYDVSIALCCEKVCTLQGQGMFGDVKVAYNVETTAYTCAHGKKIKTAAAKNDVEDVEEEDGRDEDEDNDPDGSKAAARSMRQLEQAANAGHNQALDFDAATFENDIIADAISMHGRGTARSVTMQNRKAVRNQRKAFSRIPCGEPVLSVSLYGRALIWGNNADNKMRYQFCPNCASLHVFSTLNFSASETGHYRCAECARKELMHVPAHECAYCGKKNIPKQAVMDTTLMVTCPALDPTDKLYDPIAHPEQTMQRMYFCLRHYKVAVEHSGELTKQALWAHIKSAQERKNQLFRK